MESQAPLISDAPLIVYLDIKSPYAFIAIQPTLQLEREMSMRFDWRPLTLDIPSYLGSARKSRGKVVQSQRTPRQWQSVKYAYMDARRYAQRQGRVLKGTEKIWDSRLANIGLQWVTEQAQERLADYFEAVYPPFWQRELNIEDPRVIAQCLHKAGVETRAFTDYVQDSGGKRHDDLQALLHPAGIYGVPTYVLDGEILFGREHLPYIRWRLGGGKDAAPDIAYPL